MAGRFHTNWAVVVGLGLVVAMPQLASAQRGGRGFGRLFGGISKADLATADEVQAELKMSDEQKSKAEEIRDQLRSDRRDLFQSGFGGFNEIRGEMEALDRKASAGLMELLDEVQRERLQGIAIQVNGPLELNDPAVGEKLQLTDEQRTKLEEVREENSQAVRDAFQDAGDLSREERREKFSELAETTSDNLLGVLTDDQRSRFDQMQGAPVEIDRSQFRGRGRRGGGGDST